MDPVPNPRVREWLLFYWKMRTIVTKYDQCPTTLIYPDGSKGKCVLDRSHLDVDWTPVDVPHADKDGKLAPVWPPRKTIAKLRAIDLAKTREETILWTDG